MLAMVAAVMAGFVAVATIALEEKMRCYGIMRAACNTNLTKLCISVLSLFMTSLRL